VGIDRRVLAGRANRHRGSGKRSSGYRGTVSVDDLAGDGRSIGAQDGRFRRSVSGCALSTSRKKKYYRCENWSFNTHEKNRGFDDVPYPRKISFWLSTSGS